MAESPPAKTVIMALAGNTFVATIKLLAFALSGSGAMLSEAIHSLADTGNQLLLFIGLKRGERESDDRFHYGYSADRFIFGVLSAAGIFFIGCGVTIYHGVTSLIEPHMPQLTATTFVVLGVSFVIEGGVLLYALVSVNRQRGSAPFLSYVREQADPATVAILLEDGAAVLGIVVATAGILLAYATGNPMWDAIGSIGIGVLLGVVAFYLVIANREHLLGRAVPEGVEDTFTEIVLRRASVRSIRDVKTRQLTPDSYQFKAEITFDNDNIAATMGRALTGHALDGARREETLRRLAAVATNLIATEIQGIERDVRAVIPQAKHIDIEVAHPALVVADDEEEIKKDELFEAESG